MADPLLELLGKLRFHTSYGQNLLAHSKEVGVLAGLLAEELDLDINLARRAGLLHDIGKVLGHDHGSDPTQSGAALARKCGEVPEVLQVIEMHGKFALALDDCRLGRCRRRDLSQSPRRAQGQG